MGEPCYKIKIRRGDQEIEVQGDKQFVLDKFGELKEELFKFREVVPTTPITATLKVEGKPLEGLSLVEFLNAKGPKSHPDKVVVMAYYLHKCQGVEIFNADDINECYSQARISRSANLNATINKTIAKGYIMEAQEKKENKKAWMITQTGERYVESNLK
jgi:hypothetical protein